MDKYNSSCGIGQCQCCELFDHYSVNCRLPACVVICAGPHLTSECAHTTKLNNPVHANCEGPHPASYSGCPKFTKPVAPQLTIPFLIIEDDIRILIAQVSLLKDISLTIIFLLLHLLLFRLLSFNFIFLPYYHFLYLHIPPQKKTLNPNRHLFPLNDLLYPSLLLETSIVITEVGTVPELTRLAFSYTQQHNLHIAVPPTPTRFGSVTHSINDIAILA
ncbi:hypothetical protein CDAR_251751 [Caerostris darwini]|uniref:Uncharacterized protein n=1 Tax=Caerostris darwini TaxID=1538125 RepID=A0AAV4V4Y6_9ARAC|nr:hypothetical protein CDAR_251751 [Caerostris darwini]